jgi:hypothetical protein
VTRLNVAEGKDYISQRDNVERPLITCNTTSMVMALEYNGHNLPTRDVAHPGVGENQPEDLLTYFLLSDLRVSKFYYDLDPKEWKKWQDNLNEPSKCYPPNENHTVLSYGTNLDCGLI